MAENSDPPAVTESDRKEFLMKMYDQMFADIDRHIMVVWQSIGVLGGAIAFFALVEKQVIPLDLACAVFAVIAGWSIAHSQEAGYWYNRNLAIIANIERQFLLKSDLRNVHYYFGQHRPKNKLLDQLKIQIVLSAGIAILLLLYHFQVRVVPGFRSPWSHFEWIRAMPYLVTVAIIIALNINWQRLCKKYAEFLRNSPGASIDASGIEYGIGHGGHQ